MRKRGLILLSFFLPFVGGVELWAQASPPTVLTIRATDNMVQSVDLTTLAVTNVGVLPGINYSFGDITWNPVTSTLFVVDGRGSNSLFRYNPATGTAVLLGTHGIPDLFGLAYDTLNNTLYGATFSGTLALYTLDQTTGVASFVGNTGVAIGGLAYDSAHDILIGINDGAGNLFQINRTTGAATLLASPGGTNDSGITFDPVNNRLLDFDFNGNLFSYDIAQGYTRTTLLSNQGAHDGIAFITSPIPEPGTLGLLGAGLALFGCLALWRKIGGLSRG